MKPKFIKVVNLLVLLLLITTLTAQVQATPAFSSPESEPRLTSVSPNPLLLQKDEIERIVDDRLERSAIVSDRVQNTVNESFGLLFTISGLTISALGAIPIFSGVVIFIFRRTILEGIQKSITDQVLNTEMQKILEEEVEKQLSSQVKEELNSKIKQKLIEFEQQANGDLVQFKLQLDQWMVDVDKDKRDFVTKLLSVDSSIIREVVEKAIADKLMELRGKTPLGLLPGWRKST